MKASRIILYIVIAAVLYYLIYKAYKNYQASGSIFSSTSEGDVDRSGSRVYQKGDGVRESAKACAERNKRDPNWIYSNNVCYKSTTVSAYNPQISARPFSNRGGFSSY